MDNQLTIFEQKGIRQIAYKGEIYFSVVDIIEVLTKSVSPRKYWTKLKENFIWFILQLVNQRFTN